MAPGSWVLRRARGPALSGARDLSPDRPGRQWSAPPIDLVRDSTRARTLACRESSHLAGGSRGQALRQPILTDFTISSNAASSASENTRALIPTTYFRPSTFAVYA